MELKEIESLLSKFGVTSPSDTQAYRNMYNFVFDPFVKLPTFQQDNGNPVQVTTAPEIKTFQAVFRKLFRSNPFPNLEAACEQAKTEFEKAVAARASTGLYKQWSTTQQLKTFETQLRSQMELQKRWIQEVDSRRRDKFQSSAREDAVEQLKAQFSVKFPFDSMKFYGEAELRKFSEELENKAVEEFEREINEKFEAGKTALPAKWVSELRQEISKFVSEAIKKNKENGEKWASKIEVATVMFVDMMVGFFEKHQFLKQSTRDSFCSKAKSKCELEYGLSGFLTEPLMKSAWDTIVEQEYRALESKWKAEGDGRIESFLESVKAHGEKDFKEKFCFELKSGELERMFSQVAEIARHNLEKEEESASEHEEDSCDEGGTDDDSSSSQNDEDNDADASAAAGSKKSTLLSVGTLYDNGFKIIIPANTKLPTKVFTGYGNNLKDNQTSSVLGIYEGEYAAAAGGSSRNKLGQIRWTGIPPAKAGVEKMDYAMRIDGHGLLHVEWEVRGSGKKNTAEFKTSVWSGNGNEQGANNNNEVAEVTSGGNEEGLKNDKRPIVTVGSRDDGGSNNIKKAKLEGTTNK